MSWRRTIDYKFDSIRQNLGQTILQNKSEFLTYDHKGDDQRQKYVVLDDNVAEANGHDQVEAEVERVHERPIALPVDEHGRAHRAVQADARDVGAWNLAQHSTGAWTSTVGIQYPYWCLSSIQQLIYLRGFSRFFGFELWLLLDLWLLGNPCGNVILYR